jgi:hypothetical protein
LWLLDAMESGRTNAARGVASRAGRSGVAPQAAATKERTAIESERATRAIPQEHRPPRKVRRFLRAREKSSVTGFHALRFTSDSDGAVLAFISCNDGLNSIERIQVSDAHGAA